MTKNRYLKKFQRDVVFAGIGRLKKTHYYKFCEITSST